MALGRPLGAKLFIEGIEVPFLGATVTCTVNQASIAYVDLVPHQAINDIKPRTHVVIAMRDFNNASQNYPYVTAWEGEVFGFNFGKSTNSRSFSISCIDTTSYWDNALCYFFNTQQSLGAGAMQILRAGLDFNTAVAQGITPQPSNDGPNVSYFATIVSQTLKDSTKTFLDAFVAVLRNLTKVNDFYSFAEERLRIEDRIVLNSSGLLKTLIDQTQGANWFQNIVGQSGGFTTVRNVVQDLLSIIFHDFTPIPFPARVAAANLTGQKLTGIVGDTTTTVGSYAFKPNVYMLPPPMCNIFFPDEYSQFQFSRSFFKEPTRLIYRPQMPFFGGTNQLALLYEYQPDSFQAFMFKQNYSAYQNSSDTGITGNPGYYYDDNTVEKSPDSPAIAYTDSTAVIREGQFLTNEERMKGIWMAQESLMPASTMFNLTIKPGTSGSFTYKIANYMFYKKRFETRQIQITSHLKLSVVPGFNVLILDDSDAQQNVLAYCESVTHRIYATEGGYTNVVLAYARTPDEESQASGENNAPPIPPWFDPDIFGTVTTPPVSQADATGVADAGPLLVSNSNLSTFYQTLLGGKGYKAITDYAKGEPTVPGAVAFLLNEYRMRRGIGAEDLQSYIANTTGRDYINVADTMAFLGASLPKNTKVTPDTLVVFSGGAFSTADKNNGAVTALRQKPIQAYVEALQKYRGFRG